MSADTDKEEYRETGEQVKRAVYSDDLIEAMRIALEALRSAISRNNQQLKDLYLSLVWSVYVLLEEQYASKDRKKHRPSDA